MQEKIRLNDTDWDILLPADTVKIGERNITVKPLGIEQLSIVLKRIGQVVSDWQDVLILGINKKQTSDVDLFNQIKNMIPKIAELISQHGIDVISILSNIHEDDRTTC